jgi:hypothetical protein
MQTLIYRRRDGADVFGMRFHCPAKLAEKYRALGWSTWQPVCAYRSRMRVYVTPFPPRRPTCRGRHD